MANIKLKNNYWVTESIYDTTDSKTQKQVNADLHQDIENLVSDISDLNDAINACKWVGSFSNSTDITTQIDALPNEGAFFGKIASPSTSYFPGATSGYVYVFSYSAGHKRVFYLPNGGVDLTYMRWKSSTWRDWVKLPSREETYNKANISLFRRIGVIGDSFCAGEQYYSGAHHDLYQLSWGAILGRDAGVSVELYAKGGQSVASFLDSSDASYNTYGYGKVSSDFTANNQCGLFIIALGLNDAYVDTAGENISTFTSNLGTLVDNINTLYSNTAKIILLTFKRLRTTKEADDAYNSAIISVGSAKNVPVIDVRDLEYFKSAAYINRYDSSSHPTADNYAGMAFAIRAAIENKMFGNSYFENYRNLMAEDDVSLLTQSVKKTYASTAKTTHTVHVPNGSAHLLIFYGAALVTYGVLWVSATSTGALGYNEIAKDTSGHAACPVISYGTGQFTITYNSARNLYLYDFCVYGNMCYLS